MSSQEQQSNPIFSIGGITITERDLLVAATAAVGVLIIYAVLRALTR